MKSRFQKLFIATFLVTVGAWSMAWVFSAMAGESTNDTLKKFQGKLNDQTVVRKNEALVLDGVTEIKVVAGSIDIDVDTIKEPQGLLEFYGPAPKDGEPYRITREGSTLKIDMTPHKGKFTWQISNDGEPTQDFGLKLKLPTSFAKSLNIESGAGDIEAKGLVLEKFKLEAGSGDLDLENCEIQNAEFEAGSGDAEIEHFKGSLNITVSSGEITVKDFSGKELRAETSSGDIQFAGLNTQTVSGESSSGDISVQLGDGKGWSFDLKASSGDISNAFESSAGGPNMLRLRASSGDISVIR